MNHTYEYWLLCHPSTVRLKYNFSVDGEIISSIGNGLCVLIGIKRDDGAADIEYM